MRVEIRPSSRTGKKYMAILPNRTVHFGAAGYDDFTIHGDTSRKYNYIARHMKNEDWTESGINTAGFWAKHMLWNKVNLKDSARDLSRRLGLSIRLINVG